MEGEKNWGGALSRATAASNDAVCYCFFYNDCFNVNFQIADDAFVMELRDSIRIYEEAAKTK